MPKDLELASKHGYPLPRYRRLISGHNSSQTGDALNSESVALHFGVGFVFAPAPDLSTPQVLAFLQKLAVAERGITFQQTQQQPNALTLTRANPPLTVTLSLPGAPQGATGIGQLAIISSSPQVSADEFSDSAEDVLSAYQEVWASPAQLIMRDCVVRYLYEMPTGHAFQYLWEERLHQSADTLVAFERPILGGGLRFVIPPRDGQEEPALDVKVESFLQNPKQLFVEVSARWGPGPNLDPTGMLTATNNYVNGPVMNFLQSENGNA